MSKFTDARDNINLILMNSIETTLTNELAESIMELVNDMEEEFDTVVNKLTN
jgi:Ni,Fe-hydrogenase III large subunit